MDRISINDNAYDNCEVYHPSGKLMFYCSLKRLNWYLSKNLAETIGVNKIKLTFTPKGNGEPNDLLYPRENKCVVCGTKDNLTKHHVIPYQYRKLFTPKYKDKNSYDVVVMCRLHHDEYERYADELKIILEEKYSPNSNRYNNDLRSANKLYNILNNKYKQNLIPKERIDDIETNILKICYKHDWDINELPDIEEINSCKLIIDNIGTEELILMWKDHFISNVDAKWLHKNWDKNFIKRI